MDAGFEIVDKSMLAPTIGKFVVKAPYVARKARAGNFVIIRLDETGERIPLTIVEADPAQGTITLIVQAVGKTTKALCAKVAGDVILDVVGPLGNPTPIARVGAVACVGGGVGTAELYPIARALRAAGNAVHTIIGARTRELVILENEMRGCSDSLTVTTDDGSYGQKGLVTDALATLLDEHPDISEVFAIGPLVMMRAVTRLAEQRGRRCVVSLNAIMVDGTGMCGGCRVTVGGKMRFACVDGPEFEGAGVDFDELIARTRSYVDMERLADERAACRAETPATVPAR
ncbi:MAG: sulfide/dihydroorotate dehydrogenase-like FAD/NAD-binding protein [Armatimonadota bacterium]|nr:sulfide/dihydroorotate dehydrogenase-like FAD/NAD-binding protein [Armatimonadota bacterium]